MKFNRCNFVDTYDQNKINKVLVNGTQAQINQNTYTAQITVQPGENQITVEARDLAGNKTTNTIAITYTGLGGALLTYQYDQNSNLTQASKNGKTISYTYDVFGETTIKDKDDNVYGESQISNEHLYCGARLEPETKLYSTSDGSACYDIETGRSVTKPISKKMPYPDLESIFHQKENNTMERLCCIKAQIR